MLSKQFFESRFTEQERVNFLQAIQSDSVEASQEIRRVNYIVSCAIENIALSSAKKKVLLKIGIIFLIFSFVSVLYGFYPFIILFATYLYFGEIRHNMLIKQYKKDLKKEISLTKKHLFSQYM